MSFIDFQSLTEIQKNRSLEREERQRVLNKAKERHEKEMKREKEAREKGETTWMLPSVEDKINSKEKKRKKKEKKNKKEKKAKKKKKKKQSSSSSSESEVEDSIENVWVEKFSTEPPTKREEWMEISSLFKTQTREQMKIADGSSRALKKLEERKRKEEVNKPGTHTRELNPYYKDGGVGLPSQEATPPSNAVKTSSYDASWLRRALQRAKDQALEERKTLEEVAAERWGSLETFNKLLKEAEDDGKQENKDQKDIAELEEKTSKESYKRRESEKDNYKNKGSSESRIRRRRSRSSDKIKRSRNRSTSSDRKKRNRDRRSSSDRQKRSKDRSRSRSRNRKKRSRDRERSRDRHEEKKNEIDDNSNTKKKSGNSSRSLDRNRHRRSRSTSSSDSSSSSRSRSNSDSSADRKRSGFRRTQDKHRESKNEKSGKLQMMKPPESDDESPSQRRKPLFKKVDDEMDYSIDSYTKINTSLIKNKPASWRKKEAIALESISEFKQINSPKSDKSSSSSSSSSGSESEEEKPIEIETPVMKEKPVVEVTLLSDKEMNQLGAKLTKAELLGNTALVEKLKSKLEAARNVREEHKNKPPEIGPKDETKKEEENVVILTRTDRSGFTRPVESSSSDDRGGKKKKKKAQMFADGKRESYFEDDFKVDLNTMFEKEKTTSAEDQIASLINNMPRYNTEKLTDDFDVDDMFIDKIAPKQNAEKEKERDRKNAIWEHQKTQKALDACHFCVENKNMKKHLIVALGKKCYVSLPYHQSLTEGHCLIVPLNHVPRGTQADEDLWEEIMNFRQALVRMFSSNDEDCIFFEMAKFHQTQHMILQCVPLPKETGDLAPIYFKKAILECDEEWAQNKKLIDLKGRNVRKAVPKELPYFSVDFGMSPGFAHVIENERLFPNNFAQEIIGGMIDADYSLYRKPKSENFDQQRKKVLKFAKMFQPFDPTE